MKVLILGGTGAMGVHLVQLLSSDQENEITVTSRKLQTSNVAANVKFIVGDAKDYVFLKSILVSKWDVIIDFMIYSTAEFKSRINDMLNSADQYIYLSSSRVYSNSEEPITETTLRLLDASDDEEYLKTDEYALTKARQENILRESGYNNWTIIRPYITYSENRLQLDTLEKEDWLYRAINGKTIVFNEDILRKKTTLTYGKDVSQAIKYTIGNKKALSNTFHITIDQSILWQDVFDLYLDILENYLGKRPKVKLLNLDDFIKISGSGNYQIMYDRMYNRCFDNSNISGFMDTNSFLNTEPGLKMCLEKLLEKPRFNIINWSSEAKKGVSASDVCNAFTNK